MIIDDPTLQTIIYILSGLGGFAGAYIFIRIIIEFILWLIIRKINTYIIADKASGPEVPGKMIRRAGRSISSEDASKEYEVKHKIWVWDNDTIKEGINGEGEKSSSVIYGPYSTDFSEPGFYSVSFKIRGVDFRSPSEDNDLELIELDVDRSMYRVVVVKDRIENGQEQNIFSRKFIRLSNLSDSGWHNYTLKFYSDAQGIWEFRIHPFDGKAKSPDNFSLIDYPFKILFDTVTVKKHHHFKLP